MRRAKPPIRRRGGARADRETNAAGRDDRSSLPEWGECAAKRYVDRSAIPQRVGAFRARSGVRFEHEPFAQVKPTGPG